jgi:hypothetical protein
MDSTRLIEEAYFHDDDAVVFAESLGAAVRGMAGLSPRASLG